MSGARFLALVAISAGFAGCGGGGEVADRVEENAENRAAAMEAASRSMSNALQQNVAEQRANMVRRAGEERAEAIRASDLDEDQLSNEQKNALIAGE